MVGQSFCPRAAMEQGTAQPTRSCRFIRMHSREWWEVGSEAGERRTCQSTGAGNRRCSCVGRTVVVLWTDEREGAAAASGKIPCRVVYTGRRISEEPCHHRRRDMWLYARAKSPEAERGKGRGQKGGVRPVGTGTVPVQRSCTGTGTDRCVLSRVQAQFSACVFRFW